MQLFCDWLTEVGHDVLVCRDPGSTPLSEHIRSILLGGDFRIDFRAEMLLYMASRAQLVEEVIRPAIADGKTVVSDRFILANVAYQGPAGAIPSDEIWRVGEIATRHLLPDLTFVLDLSPEAAALRLPEKRDRIEIRGDQYYAQVRKCFLEQAARFPKQNVVIDASQTVTAIQQDVRTSASRLL